jgi:hypothetical protein
LEPFHSAGVARFECSEDTPFYHAGVLHGDCETVSTRTASTNLRVLSAHVQSLAIVPLHGYDKTDDGRTFHCERPIPYIKAVYEESGIV